MHIHLHVYARYTLTYLPHLITTINQMFRTANMEGTYAFVEVSFLRAQLDRVRVDRILCWLTSADKSHPRNLRTLTNTCSMAGNRRRETIISSHISLSSTFLWLQNCEMDRRLAFHGIQSYQKAFKLEPHRDKQPIWRIFNCKQLKIYLKIWWMLLKY